MSELVQTTMIASLVAAVLGSLATYFFSTREIEATIINNSKKQAEDVLEIHKDIEHRKDTYDIIDDRIEKHKQECGLRLENTTTTILSSIRLLELQQVKTQSAVNNLDNKITDLIVYFRQSTQERG